MFSNAEYFNMFCAYVELQYNISSGARLHNDRYPNREPVSGKILTRVVWNLREKGQFTPAHTCAGRSRTVRCTDTEDLILDYVEENPSTSVRQLEQLFGVPHSTAHRILKDSGQRSYHIYTVQALLPPDLPARLLFCQWVISAYEENPEMLNNILWTDESTFTRSGAFNRRNEHLWSYGNPFATRSLSFQYRWKINVWAGIIGTEIIGPFFLSPSLTAAEYLEFLQNHLSTLLEDVPLNVRQQMLLQQDGAPPHFGQQVRQYLNQRFEGRWIGRSGSIPWPPRSPDLNPFDFFLWGYIKQKVYAVEIDSENTLRDRIISAFAEVRAERIVQRVHLSLIRRARQCIETGGDVFEHLL
ncbi:histone-lysine N-methyltransferase SETMAR-like [Calliopsis andreniformis]|uniref:histone-lysine N-methyltransferase SETMAR-like n=1 Tax=Calliopsis andreniformis TaxID=337506 RepID=UPI003FCEA459